MKYNLISVYHTEDMGEETSWYAHVLLERHIIQKSCMNHSIARITLIKKRAQKVVGDYHP